LWRPEFIPTAVLLGPAPARFRGAIEEGAVNLDAALADRTGLDGRHLILSDPEGDHRIWLLPSEAHQPLAVIIPLDENFSFRVAGAQRFRRWMTNRPAGRFPRSMLLTNRHRARLVLMLRALDMRRANATYREIAASLFGAKAVAEHGWKTLPVRGRTIRLVQDANTMTDSGYLKLLRGD
jgi:hypothetical protein